MLLKPTALNKQKYLSIYLKTQKYSNHSTLLIFKGLNNWSIFDTTYLSILDIHQFTHHENKAFAIVILIGRVMMESKVDNTTILAPYW